MDLTLNYGNIQEDNDGDSYIDFKYNIVGFSKEEKGETSLPTIFFIPKEYELPEELNNGFLRCSYKSKGDEIGEDIECWLHEHADVSMPLHKLVIASDKSLLRHSCGVIPKFN